MQKGSKNAKVASKNNPSSRGAKIKMFYNSQEVVPVKYIGTHIGNGTYMAISLVSGDLVLDSLSKPCKWDLAKPLSQ